MPDMDAFLVNVDMNELDQFLAYLTEKICVKIYGKDKDTGVETLPKPNSFNTFVTQIKRIIRSKCMRNIGKEFHNICFSPDIYACRSLAFFSFPICNLNVRF